jgi:hypothetical protein
MRPENSAPPAFSSRTARPAAMVLTAMVTADARLSFFPNSTSVLPA